MCVCVSHLSDFLKFAHNLHARSCVHVFLGRFCVSLHARMVVLCLCMWCGRFDVDDDDNNDCNDNGDDEEDMACRLRLPATTATATDDDVDALRRTCVQRSFIFLELVCVCVCVLCMRTVHTTTRDKVCFVFGDLHAAAARAANDFAYAYARERVLFLRAHAQFIIVLRRADW